MVAELLRWLDSAVFVIAGVPVSWSELLGDVTGAACVVLVAKQHVWNWPLGLANNVFWALLFWRAKLYSDSSLQVIFFALGCYGWWRWTREREPGPDMERAGGRQRAGTELPVRRMRAKEWTVVAGLVVICTAGLAAWLSHATDSPAPIADATVLSLSLAATWAQAEKIIESWWIWITVDLISVPLYVSRSLYPTAGLYVIFGILCVFGLRGWSRTLAAQGPS